MPKYTKEELIAIAERVLATRERDKLRAKANALAIKQLIADHESEFKTLLKDAKAELGL